MLSVGKKKVTVPTEEATAKYVPAAAVIRMSSFSECKVLSVGKKKVTVPTEEAMAKYVPAAAVIRMSQALSGFSGRKARLGGLVSLM